MESDGLTRESISPGMQHLVSPIPTADVLETKSLACRSQLHSYLSAGGGDKSGSCWGKPSTVRFWPKYYTDVMMDHTALLSCMAGYAVVEVGPFLSMELTGRSPADSFNNAGFGVVTVLGRGDFFV